MQALSEKHGAGTPKLHLSVLERIAHGTEGYAPGTLAPHVHVVYTPSGDPDQDLATEVRTKAVSSALTQAFSERGTDLEQVRGTLTIGLIAYYVYVASCLAVILAASVPENGGSRLNPWIVLKNAGALIYDAVTGQWAPLLASAERLLTVPALLETLLAGFAVSAVLAHYVDHARSQVFSRFWHQSRHELREALQAARKSLRAAAGE
jgi:hypothetical protein